MLLKKTLNRFVLKKNPKKNDKPANALPLGRKGRLGFYVYAAAVLCFCCFSIPAFAASDPLGVVNNLSDFIFSLIRAIGLILLGWGVVQVGLSFQSHDPSQRSQGFLTLAGGLFITVLAFIMILTVYSRLFKLYMYTAIAPIPMSTFAGEPTSNVGKNFLRSYAGVCLEGAIIALACIIFSVMASSPPAVDPNVSAVTAVWSYVGELIFNLLVLVGAVRMSDRIVKELLGL